MAPIDKPLFVYGTMLDREVLEIVLSRPVHPARRQRAWLEGHCIVRRGEDAYPVLVAAPGERVAGALLHRLNREDRDRIHFFESDEYDLIECTVTVAGRRPVRALRFGAAEHAPHAETWSLEWWRTAHKDRFLYYTRQFMGFYGRGTLEEAEARWRELEDADEGRAYSTHAP